MVKNLPAVWESWVQSLGRRGPLEEEMATSWQVFLPRKCCRQRILVDYNPWNSKESDRAERLILAFIFFFFDVISGLCFTCECSCGSGGSSVRDVCGNHCLPFRGWVVGRSKQEEY